jgi:hypothetical protein
MYLGNGNILDLDGTIKIQSLVSVKRIVMFKKYSQQMYESVFSHPVSNH